MPNHLLALQSMDLVSKANITKHIAGLFEELISTWSTEKLSMPEPDAEKLITSFLKTNSTYGILSHRWLPDGEPSFQDMQPYLQLSPNPNLAPNVRDQLKMIIAQGGLESWVATSETQPGLAKLVHFCKVASQQGCKYAWFDTGCINKTSSAELEESIRSMFSWYQNSKVCIVHLARTTDVFNMFKDPWFTRGWTLQELLAPKIIKFYDALWNPLTPAPNDKIHDADPSGKPEFRKYMYIALFTRK